MNDPQYDRLVAEVEALRARLAELEGKRRRRHRFFIVALAVVATTAWGQLVTFQPDQPALASEVNGNFNQLRSWIEAKVGPLAAGTGRQNIDIQGTATITGPTTITGATTVTGATTITGPTTVSAGTGNARAMLVTGTSNVGEPILDVRHDNLTQGVGFAWNGVFATGSAPNANLNLSAKGTGRVYASEFQAYSEHGYALSCGEASYSGGLNGSAFCCRIDQYNGEGRCVLATNGSAYAWGTSFAYPGMTATTPGRYAISCAAGAPGANYPFCCRINQNTGSTVCGQGSSYNLGTAGYATVFN